MYIHPLVYVCMYFVVKEKVICILNNILYYITRCN